jgi:hypothetical protein
MHYSRWLSVYIGDMMPLSEKHPAILAVFCAGKFLVHKTSNKLAIDQCHDYNNAAVKEAGRLMTNPAALRHWMEAGPNIARIEALEACNQPRDHCHHEQHLGVEAAFKNL